MRTHPFTTYPEMDAPTITPSIKRGIIACLLLFALVCLGVIIGFTWKDAPPPSETALQIQQQREYNELIQARAWQHYYAHQPVYLLGGALTLFGTTILCVYIIFGVRYLTIQQQNDAGVTVAIQRIPLTARTKQYIRDVGAAVRLQASKREWLTAQSEARQWLLAGASMTRALRVSPHERVTRQLHDEQQPLPQLVAGDIPGRSLREVWEALPLNLITLGETSTGTRVSYPLSPENCEDVVILGRKGKGKTVEAAKQILLQLRAGVKVYLIDEHFDPVGRNTQSLGGRLLPVLPQLADAVWGSDVLDGAATVLFNAFEEEFHARIKTPPDQLRALPFLYLWIEEWNIIAAEFPELAKRVGLMITRSRKVKMGIGLICHACNKRILPFHHHIANRICYSVDEQSAAHLLADRGHAKEVLNLGVGEAVIFNSDRNVPYVRYKGYYLGEKDAGDLLGVNPEEVERYLALLQEQSVTEAYDSTRRGEGGRRNAGRVTVVPPMTPMELQRRLQHAAGTQKRAISYPEVVEYVNRQHPDQQLTLEALREFMSRGKPLSQEHQEILQQIDFEGQEEPYYAQTLAIATV